ncbi:GntR family transcriptional regulator [Macrococcus hajekii]|uniref:GntR family transcriptional regulator n=1 Tax=Macrococcus hajekii TaxID=198482 RepID=A0A4R6BMS6_9STAP|nr:GntR family transcriptional regulator [Macrococcus hajekii]TDM03144.1 GntR family transcriptional regulator [Macrococcus hajekii]GGA96318.1 GntR family transcriptional regulator [Macrococcus hajekii]
MSVEQSIVTIKDWIIARIQNGTFKKDEPLPSIYDMSRTLHVVQDDVENALQELVTEQIVTERFHEGYFIKHEPTFFYPVDNLKSITTMIEEKGYTAGSIIISQDPEIPSIDDKRILEVEDDRHIIVLERMRTANGAPIAYCLDKIVDDSLIIECANGQLSLFEVLKDKPDFQIKSAICEIESISYEPHISNMLECSPEESLVLVRQIHQNSAGRPVLYSLNYFKSSQIKFQIKREMK